MFLWWGRLEKNTVNGMRATVELTWRSCGMGTVTTWPSLLTGVPLAHHYPRTNSKPAPLLWADTVLDSPGSNPYSLPTGYPWAVYDSHNWSGNQVSPSCWPWLNFSMPHFGLPNSKSTIDMESQQNQLESCWKSRFQAFLQTHRIRDTSGSLEFEFLTSIPGCSDR